MKSWFSLWTNFAFWCGCCLSHGNLHALLLVRKLSRNELSDLISWNCSKLVIRIYKSWLHKCILHDLAIFNMAKLNLGTSCPTSECSWQHKCILHDVSNYNLQYSTLITCITSSNTFCNHWIVFWADHKYALDNKKCFPLSLSQYYSVETCNWVSNVINYLPITSRLTLMIFLAKHSSKDRTDLYFLFFTTLTTLSNLELWKVFCKTLTSFSGKNLTFYSWQESSKLTDSCHFQWLSLFLLQRQLFWWRTWAEFFKSKITFLQ